MTNEQRKNQQGLASANGVSSGESRKKIKRKDLNQMEVNAEVAKMNQATQAENQMMRSVNEPQQYNIPTQPITAPQPLKTNAEVEAVREQNKPTQPPSQPAQTGPQLSKIVNTQKYIGDMDLRDYNNSKFNRAEFEKSEDFKSLVKGWKNEIAENEKKYKDRQEKSSKWAKYAAWGNMLNALGQLAGMGKQVYVAPDKTYLNDALSKADKARELYDAAQETNRKYLEAKKTAYIDAAEKQYNTSQKEYNDRVKQWNDLQYKIAEANGGQTQLTSDNSQAQFDEKMGVERGKLAISERRAKTAEDTLAFKKEQQEKKDKANASKKDFYVSYMNSDNKKGYDLDKSRASEILNLMTDGSYNFDKNKLSLIKSTILGTYQDESKKMQAMGLIQEFLDENYNDERVQKILAKVTPYDWAEGGVITYPNDKSANDKSAEGNGKEPF